MSLKRKILILVLAEVLVFSLIFLVVLPITFSDHFFSCRFEPYCITEPIPIHPSMRIEIPDGQTCEISYVGFKVWFNNSYFMPIRAPYNGFDKLVFIYNSTVEDPTNVLENDDFLVWGAYYNPHKPGKMNMGILTGEDYEYYLANKDINNYTKPIRPGAHSSTFFVQSSIGEPIWHGQDLNHQPIPVGTYYLYTVLYGKIANPQPYELIVLEMYWPN